MNHRKSVFYVLFVLLVIHLCFFPAFSAQEASPQHKINLLKLEIKNIKAELDKQLQTKSKTDKELNRFDREIAELSRQLRLIRQESANIDKELKKLTEIKSSLAVSISANKESLAQLARTFYMLGKQDYLKILINNEDVGRQGRTQIYFEYLSTAYQQKVKQLDAELIQKNNLLSQLETKQQYQTDLLAKVTSQKEKLSTKQALKKDYLKTLAAQIKAKQKNISQLKADQEGLEKLAKAILNRKKEAKKSAPSGMAFANNKRTLQWPVEGKVTNKFGSSRLEGKLKWRGVLIATEFGADVRAVEEGQVVFADWLSGYGYVLILEHSGGYMSLYGHNRQLLKDVGESISKNDLIAEAGSSGRGGDPALYFEIRHKGKPVNPVKWMISKNSRRN